MDTDPLPLLEDLIRCPSVTPTEAGALDCLEAYLRAAGFQCQRLVFSDKGTPDVDNLFARFGKGGPHLCFAGHIDVVPPGRLEDWAAPPFAAFQADGFLYGRGAADMKGSVAAFATAAADAVRNGLIDTMVRFHQRFDLLLTPTVAVPALPVGYDLSDPHNQEHWIDWTPFSYPFNMTRQPAATVPCGLAKGGLPIGLHLVGRWHEDGLVLRAARAFEAARPFGRPPIQ